jgi:hypothetical protein
MHIDKRNSDEFIAWESGFIEASTYSLDFAVIADTKNFNPDYESKAQVLIERITIIGSDEGGAASCEKCPAGFWNDGSEVYCSPSDPGHTPNKDQTEQELCPYGYFNPFTDGQCIKCPEYTYSDDTRT